MTRLILAMTLSLTLGCAGLHPGAQPGGATGNPESFDDLLVVVLRRSFVDPKDLADSQLLGDGPEIVIRSDIPDSPRRIGAGVLPVIEGTTFLLLSSEQIRARAARQGDVYFLAVDELRFTGDDAEFFIGVDVTTVPERPVSCCCSHKVRYSRTNGIWTYEGASEFRCA